MLRESTDAALVPASEEWVRGRIATLLAHYFVNDMPEELRKATADDWVAAIMADPVPPAWAIQNAVVNWLRGPKAGRRPLPGDIVTLIREELGWVYHVKSRLFLEDHPKSAAWHPLADKIGAENGKTLALGVG